ncbi:hypothetical protein VNO77_02321 [Canavalia gladiata]|uniref:Uncharacterized protein n=1 Tax=Canavalia gladiata TaxID=3824 RepID=A0AAN9R2Y1_CANGL
MPLPWLRDNNSAIEPVAFACNFLPQMLLHLWPSQREVSSPINILGHRDLLLLDSLSNNHREMRKEFEMDPWGKALNWSRIQSHYCYKQYHVKDKGV